MLKATSLYADSLISATELNRQPGRVLDLALKQPVTITRNDEAFALMRREDAARLLTAASHIESLMALIQAILQRTNGIRLDDRHPYRWLETFDGEELDELLREVRDVVQQVLADKLSWDEFEAVVREWRESAVANASAELAAAFEAKADEVPLTVPEVERPIDR